MGVFRNSTFVILACISFFDLGKYTLTTFLSPIRVQRPLSTCVGMRPLFKFFAIRTKQFFFAISTTVNFSLVSVGVINSSSTATADLNILLHCPGEDATIYVCSWSIPLRIWVISNSLNLLKLPLIIDSKSLCEGRLERDLLVILSVRSSFEAMLSKPQETLATVVSSSIPRRRL
jgi:hypothetical protein